VIGERELVLVGVNLHTASLSTSFVTSSTC